MNTLLSNRLQRFQPVAQKSYWKTYIVFGSLLGICALINVVASVESMYSSSNAQEFSFKKSQLAAQIQELEQQKSAVANLRSIQSQALAAGFAPVTHLQYASIPLSQKVAER